MIALFAPAILALVVILGITLNEQLTFTKEESK